MVDTLYSGPVVTAGNTMDGAPGAPQFTNPLAGPNISYHGNSLLDPRYFPIAKDSDNHGVIPAFMAGQQILTVSGVPQTLGVAKIAALAHVATGVAMTLAAASAGVSKNIPILPFGTSTPVVAGLALDLGFEIASVTSGSKNVTVADSSKYIVGMPLVIAEALTTTTPLITYVTGITSATVITVANAAGRSNSTTASVATGNAWGVLDNISPIPVSTYVNPYLAAGSGLFFDPTQALARCVEITGVNAGAGGNFIVNGWDIYGVPMSDLITVAAGINTVAGTKAFKYIKNVIPQFTDAQNYDVGTTDVFGFPLRSDSFDQTLIFDDQTLITANTGYTAADATSPATNLTGDTRGTYALQTASDGVDKVTIYQMPSFQQQVRTKPNNFVPLFGVTQV